MRRAILVGLAIIALWFGLKDWGYRTYLSQGTPLTAASPDYETADGWIARPATQPPGGWQSPWGVDLFIVAPPSSAPAKAGEVMTGNETLAALRATLPRHAIYAPHYRHASPALDTTKAGAFDAHSRADLQAAFDHYMEKDNRLRGLLIVVPDNRADLVAPLLSAFRTDADLRQRFAGVLELKQAAQKRHTSSGDVMCSDVMTKHCVIDVEMPGDRTFVSRLLPNLPRPHVTYTLADPEAVQIAVDSRVKLLSDWMDSELPKPAEPMGGFDTMETIEVAPIRRPGETDADDEN